MRRDLAVLTAAAAAVTGAAVGGTLLWNRRTAAAVEHLSAPAGRDGKTTGAPSERAFRESDLTGLPEGVARYFRFALPAGHAVIRAARLRQAGEMRLDAGKPWAPFTAVEHVSVQPPGFVWDASWRALPLIPARVRDSYVGGQGATQILIGGLVRSGPRGSAELAWASLTRYLAEAAWVPTALLPRYGVAWSEEPDGRARATLRDGDVTASIVVEFATDGSIERVSALRYRDVGGRFILTPWAGRFDAYERTAGMMIPRRAAVEWIPAGEPVAVWRARIVAADYDLALGPAA